MNNLQTQAIAYFRKFMEEHGNLLSTGKWAAIPHEITRWEVKTTDYGTASIFCTRDQGTPGSMLHAMGHECWLVFVGKRGKLTVRMAPKSFQQFNGRNAFRMTFKTNGA